MMGSSGYRSQGLRYAGGPGNGGNNNEGGVRQSHGSAMEGGQNAAAQEE